MRIIKGVPDQSDIAQLCKDNYWLTILTMLKANVPWELISSISDQDIAILLGGLQAISDYEQEVQDRESRRSQQGYN